MSPLHLLPRSGVSAAAPKKDEGDNWNRVMWRTRRSRYTSEEISADREVGRKETIYQGKKDGEESYSSFPLYCFLLPVSFSPSLWDMIILLQDNIYHLDFPLLDISSLPHRGNTFCAEGSQSELLPTEIIYSRSFMLPRHRLWISGLLLVAPFQSDV